VEQMASAAKGSHSEHGESANASYGARDAAANCNKHERGLRHEFHRYSWPVAFHDNLRDRQAVRRINTISHHHAQVACWRRSGTFIYHGVLEAWILFDFSAFIMNSGHFVVGGMGPGTPAHATMIASLAGLPNELHKIFTSLSTGNLLTLAAVCHRLHLIALSTYLSAHGIDLESLLSSPTLVLTSKQMNALPGLLTMLTRPRAKSVRFVWYGSRPEYTIVDEVSHVARWIEMLDDLEQLDLDFRDVGWGHLVDMSYYGTPLPFSQFRRLVLRTDGTAGRDCALALPAAVHPRHPIQLLA